MEPWFKAIAFPYNEELISQIRHIPGCTWDRDNRVWVVPIEMLEPIKKLGAKYGCTVKETEGATCLPKSHH